MSALYRPSPTKRRRRTRAEIDVIEEAMYESIASDHPMTVRQVYYRLVSQGVIAKTEAEYKQTVCRLLGEMRREGTIPYPWIADATRWMRRATWAKPSTTTAVVTPALTL